MVKMYVPAIATAGQQDAPPSTPLASGLLDCWEQMAAS